MPEQELTEEAKLRLRRIEGQVRGISRMLDRMGDDFCADEDEPCDGLVTQVLAVRAAVEQVGRILMEVHLQRCVLRDMEVDERRLQDLRDSLKLWSRLN